MTLGRHIDRHRRRVVRECGLNGWQQQKKEEKKKKEAQEKNNKFIKKQSSTSPISPNINNMIYFYYDNTQ